MRCALYVRVSSDEQRRKGFSLPEQRKALEEHAKKKGYTIVDTYADEGISASKKPHLRHEFQRMMNDVAAGYIDIIVFLKIDRWFRSVRDYYKTQDFLDKHGVKWETVIEEYDTTSRTGKLNLNIKLTIAEDEALSTSERVKFVLDGKLLNKEPVTGNQPFGYKIFTKDGKKYIDYDPETRAECEDMFNYFFSTLSGYETTKYINEKYGRNHADNTITRRLKNIAYTGEHRGVIDYRPPYITHEQRAIILNVFSQNTRTPRKENKVYLFSGLIKCPECGKKLASCTSNKTTLAYRCRYHAMNVCDYRHTVKEELVEEYLLDNIFKEYRFKTKVKKKKKAESPIKYEEQLERLNNVYILGNISKTSYDKKVAELKSKIADLRAENSAHGSIPQSTIDMLSNGQFSAIYEGLERKEQRAFWKSLVDSIEIDGENVSINFIP